MRIKKVKHKSIDEAVRELEKNKNIKGVLKLNNPKLGEILLIKSFYDIDVTNWNRFLYDDNIRHIINEHGKQSVESKRNQLAITLNDIKNIPNILYDYDNIYKGNSNGKYKTIIYEKKYCSCISYLVEVIVHDQKKLQIKTMWKKYTTKIND